MLTFSFLLALNFLSCSTVSGRWILYAYLSLSCTHTKDGEPEHTYLAQRKTELWNQVNESVDDGAAGLSEKGHFPMFVFLFFFFK